VQLVLPMAEMVDEECVLSDEYLLTNGVWVGESQRIRPKQLEAQRLGG